MADIKACILINYEYTVKAIVANKGRQSFSWCSLDVYQVVTL